MADAKSIADQFISRSGRTPAYDRDAYVSDMVDLAAFLAWAEEDGAYYAGVVAKDAFRAMCRLLDVDVIALRKTALGT